MRITNPQKKELSEIFNELELYISDFTTSGQHKEFIVKYKYEYYSFALNKQKEDDYYLTILPTNNTKGYSLSTTWVQAKVHFKTWAEQISKELNTPTGWETFENNDILNSDLEDLNSKFTESEKEEYRNNIRNLKERLSKLELEQESLSIINEKLDQLDEKLDTLSKFDWKALFIGSMASLILMLGIPTELNGIIWENIKIAFNNVKMLVR